MKIERSHYRAAYEQGKLVYSKESEQGKSVDYLQNRYALNRNSAADFIGNLRKMLNGERYTRTLSADATDDFLAWISSDYGEHRFRNAVSAVVQHIEYYQSLRDVRMKALSLVVARHQESITSDEEIVYPNEIDDSQVLTEGVLKRIAVNIYERNRKARELCITHHGCVCKVCNCDFELVYGSLGAGFIHVHHLIDIATVQKEYAVDPVLDLVPVCPNCHAMLHKSKPAYTVEEMKEILERRRAGGRC